MNNPGPFLTLINASHVFESLTLLPGKYLISRPFSIKNKESKEYSVHYFEKNNCGHFLSSSINVGLYCLQ